MDGEPTPKEFRKKDESYMRRAYIYTAILLVLGLIGGLLLAERIVTAEQNHGEMIEEQVDDDAQPPATDESAPGADESSE